MKMSSYAPVRRTGSLVASLLLLTLLCGPTGASAAFVAGYRITIANLTLGQIFSPPLLVTHQPEVRLFEAGEPASDQLALLAEGGDAVPLQDLLGTLAGVQDSVVAGGPVPPAGSITLDIDGVPLRGRLSAASMLVHTNDAFLALDGVPLPFHRGETATYFAIAYDAGSELNEEFCEAIPGPACNGDGASPEAGGEGFVFVHPGVSGIGELMPADYDWRNPVAKVVIKRVKGGEDE